MKIVLSEDKKITFLIHEQRLYEALLNCDLGVGTSSFPITIDGFVTINDPELYEFLPGETITMKFAEQQPNPVLDFQVVGCKLNNVGQDFNKAAIVQLDPWKGIFVEDTVHIKYLPDGSLFITPVADSCSISIPREEEPYAATRESYICYSIIFSAVVSQNKLTRTYYFQIDPLIKITSGGR
ncbi:hypothetical protein [Spongiimicrobium salis]|uniref:hypothetical protein n=1 Tax=Spongiimicrobium salis TaxID=1667022 RepID=UPI00374D3731